MPQTPVSTDLLQPLKIVTHFGVDAVGQDLGVLAIDDVTLPVQEPRRDLELGRVLDDSHETLELIGVELASSAKSPSITPPGQDSSIGRTAC